MEFSTGLLLLVAAASPQQVTPPPPVADQAPAQPADPDADKPIIPEAEFDKALPPLSNDINAPLEPIAIEPIGAPPPVTVPPTAPTPQEPAELSQPLPPLATFDSTPFVTVADVEDKETQIRYDTVLKGLDGIGLGGQFNSLSALKDGGGKAANATMVSARAREDEALAGRLMRSLGYYDGTAISTIEVVKGADGKTTDRLRAIVSATPGKLYHLSSVTIVADPVVPADLITTAMPLKTGDPIDAARVQGAEANVSTVLPQQGYPFAKVGQRDIILDDATTTGAYTLPVDVGPRSSFGAYTTTGTLAFDAQHVGVLARFKKGELWDTRKVDDLRQALIATGLLSTVSVEPVQTGQPGPDGTQQVDLLVRQIAGPPRSLAVSGGYSTGQGFRLEGTFTHRNLWEPEGALIVNVIGGSQEQGLSTTFRRSNAGKRDRTVSLTASANHSNYDAYNAFTGTLAGRISYDSTPIWQKRLTYNFGFELTGTNESIYDFTALDKTRKTYFIAALPVQALWDTSDNLLNPTKGYRVKVNLSPEASVKGKASPYVRGLVEASAYYPVSDSLVIAGRVRAGSIMGISRNELAPSRRYYGGGGGSVRGYGYQRLGPFDPNGDPVGGRSLSEFSIEARYRFGNFGIVPFFDGGNSYESSIPGVSDLKFGAGIGGRFYTNFGPLRVDVATPLNKRKGDGLIALYISIGQAF
ncbi:autotransporter assembly complex protein TamA [Sphingomonas immobilis]|uniref:BamA/TamA family outer membrane protein n=1 Tax=Sphingomonas immobilis TaxID=3063997 RepID=A0ABT8ZUE9_9SPHN|nr:BamA/TamA family outer membrane protein [Sphingomonas sp. CA1-15]MDO7841195.1 BamA/TamA family outer membrane protein [Sphingomonas sp. CA1-15]